MNKIEFIETVFLKGIRNIINSNENYLAFSLIIQAVETLGMFELEFDDKSVVALDQKDEFEKRFESGIRLFPTKQRKNYQDKKIYLRKSLRNPMIHQFRPGSNISISGDIASKKDHLKILDNNLILNIQELFTDFSFACKKMIKKLKSSKEKGKILNPYIEIAEKIAVDGQTYSASGTNVVNSRDFRFGNEGE